VDHVVAKHGVSERLACRVLGQHRSTQRKIPTMPDDEAALTADIIAFATEYGRYGYRRIAVLLRDAGWVVNVKRVERIWRREGLKVPQRQPKRGRLWLNDGSCIRLRPEYPNHVWSYDFVEDRTHNGRKYRMLNIIDEFTRECLAIRVNRKLRSTDVIDVLSDLFILRGIPGHIRSIRNLHPTRLTALQISAFNPSRPQISAIIVRLSIASSADDLRWRR
jgi:putative transposase